MLLNLIACQSGMDSRPLPGSADSPPAQVADSPGDSPAPDSDWSEPSDPGLPELGSTVETVSVTLRTRDEGYAGTDDALKLCLEGSCWGLYRDDWNDNERGAVEVFHLDGGGLAVSTLSEAVLQIDDGGDQYRPECLAVSLDGHPWLSRDELDVKLGDQSDELPEVTLLAGMDSLGCWDSVLTHGPLWGPQQPGAIGLSYRLDATRRVELFAQRQGAEHLVHIGYPSPEDDFTEQVLLEGLAPGDWRIRMQVDGDEVGSWIRTVPTGDEQSLRFAFGSCSKDTDTQPIFETIGGWDPELFLFVGDNHYGNTADLGAQRQNYRQMRDVPERAHFLDSTPILATWDDHDFVGNNTDASDPGGDIALKAFAEYWSNPGYGTDELPGAYTRHRIGEVEFFLVDDRSFRGTDDTLLGLAQTAWLLDGLQDSTADFKFVVCGSQFTSEGSSDSWAAFEDARASLHRELDARDVTGVIFLSGDIHRSELRLDPGTRVPEWTSSHLAYPTNSGCQDESWLACYDAGVSFIGVEVDTSLADPVATASIFALDGSIQATHSVALSQLGPAR
jgi:alkaline phosphatase D